MKKTKLFSCAAVATSLLAVTPIVTMTSCGNDKKEEDEKIVSLKSVNIKKANSVFTASKATSANDADSETKPTLWQTQLVDGQLNISEVVGENEESETISVTPDWTKQIDEDHMILSFSNTLHDEGNVQYCVKISTGECTKLKDFWIVQTIDEHEFAFQTVNGYIYFVATYVNFQGRQTSQGGGLIKVPTNYFDTFDSSKIVKVSEPGQWIATMVWDKGRPVSHRFAINDNGDALYYCSATDYPTNAKDNQWGLLYRKMKQDGSYDDPYKLVFDDRPNSDKPYAFATAGIYCQGNEFYFKDEGTGMVIKPTFDAADLDAEKGYCYVNLEKHKYFFANEIYGINEPYSRHIIRTKAGASKQKIVNIDNGHVFDLWYEGWTPAPDKTAKNHHAIFDTKYDFVDYTNNTAFFLNSGKLVEGQYKTQMYSMVLNNESKYVVGDPIEITGQGINVNNLKIRSFKVLNDTQVVINAYDDSQAAYAVIKGSYQNNTWTFAIDKNKYETEIDNIEVIQAA